MGETATLTAKDQLSIPKSIRNAQHWEAGQEFVFIPQGKGVLVMPAHHSINCGAPQKAPVPTITETGTTACDDGCGHVRVDRTVPG